MALRSYTRVGSMADAIAYAATLSGKNSKAMLAVMREIGSKLDIVNFDVAPGLGRVNATLKTGGAVTIRLTAVRPSHPTAVPRLRVTIPENFSDYEILYFGGLKPDGGAAVHALRSRDTKGTQKRLAISLDELVL